jgi:hypothetical protein
MQTGRAGGFIEFSCDKRSDRKQLKTVATLDCRKLEVVDLALTVDRMSLLQNSLLPMC